MGKKFEVNVDDSSVNKADLKGFKGGKKNNTNKRRGSKRANPSRGNKSYSRDSDENGNDPSWYNHYPELLKNVTGVNFGNPLGSPIEFGYPTAFTSKINAAAALCTVGFVPTLGSCYPSDIINNANKVAMQLYSAMRWKLGSTASYEANDIMMYLGAMDSAYILYALAVRIYGLTRMRSPFNYYFGENLLQAMGIDYETFADNASDFRAQINNYAIFLSSLFVPAEFDIFRRHVWMCTNVFTDSDTAKAQMYAYLPEGYYVYNEAPTGGGPGRLDFTVLNTKPTQSTLLTYKMWKDAINDVMSAIIGSSDFNQMSSDIGKAFEGSVFQVSLIPEDYITPVTYSQEVLTQFENCILNGNIAVPNSTYTGVPNLSITQAVQGVQSVARIQQNAYFVPATPAWSVKSTQNMGWLRDLYNADKLLNFHKSEISNEDVMVATRGISGDYANITVTAIWDDNVISPKSYGTEVYTVGRVISLQYDQTTNKPSIIWSEFTSFVAYQQNANVTGQINLPLQLLSLWSQFDWAPNVTIWFGEDGGVLSADLRRYQDLDVYGLIDTVQIKALNNCAVLSEFYSSKFPQTN